MRAAGAFLKERKREFWLCGGLLGTFAGVSYLYNIRMDAVEYAFLLSAVWILLTGIPDYLRFARKHKELLEAVDGFASGGEELPDAESLIEEDYQRIITRLYEEKSEAESAGRIARQEMEDYYGMWVHQIKTPIAALRVLMQAVEGCQFDEGALVENHKYTKEMRMELFKIEQYVEMVLTYLRMEALSSDLSFEIYSLDSIIRQAVRKYSQMFILKKIRLEYDPVEMNVLTDEKWLGFVLEQLLSNALKYTKTGMIRIYLEEHFQKAPLDMSLWEEGGLFTVKDAFRTREGYDDRESMDSGQRQKKEICLVIEDTGIGIWQEDLPRVFEKGFTGYNGRRDKKSTGIGLYLCKSVIDKLRHQIWIESESGKGTKVFLSLGRKKVQHE